MRTVYPSRYEGFGIPLLEAMQLGCPVACSATSSLPEVGGDAALYFDPDEPAEIQHQMDRLVFETDTAATLRQLGAQRVSGFSWQRCAAETRGIYARLRR